MQSWYTVQQSYDPNAYRNEEDIVFVIPAVEKGRYVHIGNMAVESMTTVKNEYGFRTR